MSPSPTREVSRESRETIVHDQPGPCPYLPGRSARLPMRLQHLPLTDEALDEGLALGERRVGYCLYRPECPGCQACEMLRIPVAGFRPDRSQRRALRKNQDVAVTVGLPRQSAAHLELFNRHRHERGLDAGAGSLSAEAYESWLVRSCARSVEMRYEVSKRLVGVGIVDLGRRAASSVYFFFDPEESRRSLGVFSVLQELRLCERLGMEHLYLGLHVEDCRELSYKAAYHPHERLTPGGWRRFERG